MLKKINNNTKKIFSIVLFSVLILAFLVLMVMTIDSKKISDIKEFIKTDVKVLYISNDKNLNYPVEILDKYSIDYLKIDSNHLTLFERKKIKKIIDNNNLSNILVIYVNGVIKNKLVEYKEDKSVEKFLQDNKIIPEYISEDVDKIVKKSKQILENEYSIIYIPYKKHEDIEEQDEIIKKISMKYSIDYDRIDAFLLSKNQQEEINKLLGLSNVEDQIIILVKDKKMIANIRGIHSKNTYIETLYELDFINEIENKIKEIDYDDFKVELKNNSKSIILMGLDDSKDSNNVFDLLNKMVYNYGIEVNYINLNNADSNIYKKVHQKLIDIGYEDAFSLPLVVIVESNKILDYIIGTSNEEYYLDVFIENGVIKGEIVNE